MSSEVCPFCGKTYKRLKSHLPHCKAAPNSSKTPATKHEATANQTTASMSKGKEKGKKSTESKPQTETMSSATKKTLSLSPSSSKVKKQSLRALIEASKMAPEDFLSDSRTKEKTKPKDPPKKTKNPPQKTDSIPHEGLRFWEDNNNMTTKITLQDVRTSLGRKTRSRSSILSQMEAAGVPVPHPPQNPEEQPAGKTISIESKQKDLTPQRETQPRLPPPPLPVPQRAVSMKVTGSLHVPLTSQNQPGTKTQNTTGAVTHRRLGQVTLKELPDWLIRKTPTHPRDVIEIMQRGWQWYYRKYIDVKKGGVAGVGMLLAGYCVLSYMWNYPHIKQDRWRKYH